MTDDGAHSQRSVDAVPPDAAHTDDLDLVHAALAGSNDARRTFAERMRCVPKILAVKNAHRGRPLTDEDLEDLVQETVLAIWRRLPSYEGRAALETWAYQFCHFVLMQHLRAPHRGRQEAAVMIEDAPEENRHSPVEFEDVYHALARIRLPEARLIHLRHFEQLNFDEIGERLTLPPSTVKSHYKRAVTRLKELLGPHRQETP